MEQTDERGRPMTYWGGKNDDNNKQKPTVSKMENVQTAVEWLAEKFYHEGLDDEFVKQAKEMDRDQKINAFSKGFSEGVVFGTVTTYKYKTAEEYYEETYKK